MYKLINESEKQRTYQSDVTGTEVFTSLLYTGSDGEKFWGFDDLFSMPTQRKIAAQRITDLFSAGVTADEIKETLTDIKGLIKANNPDQAMFKVQQLEENISHANDITKQATSLAAIYILTDTERIDTINQAFIMSKIERWKTFEDEQAFFLTWLLDITTAYTRLSGQLSQIASQMKEAV